MTTVSYRYCRFPPDVIELAVWLYYGFTLSFRDVERILAERGVGVSYETIRVVGCQVWTTDRAAFAPLVKGFVISPISRTAVPGSIQPALRVCSEGVHIYRDGTLCYFPAASSIRRMVPDVLNPSNSGSSSTAPPFSSTKAAPGMSTPS